MAPLVYASPKARRQAERLLPRGAVLETEVTSRIIAGSVHAGAAGGFVFAQEAGWVAKVERRAGRLRERPRSWVVVELQPYDESRGAAQARRHLGSTHAEGGTNALDRG